MDDNKKAFYAMATASRDMEIEGYQVNVDNYNIVMSTLPTGEWPENLTGYKGYSSANVADLNETLSADDIQLLGKLLWRDQITKALITEQLEQNKAQSIRDALASKLDPAELPALLATANATIAAAQAKANGQ